MYKQITVGNLYALSHQVRGRKDCNIFIKPAVDRQIEKMMIEDPFEYNGMVEKLKERNITLILEEKDRILRKVVLEKIPLPEKKAR